jgi:hypothetical protein
MMAEAPGASIPEAGDDEERTAGLVDTERLANFMDDWNLPGSGETLTARFITGGASNELFEIRRGRSRLRAP